MGLTPSTSSAKSAPPRGPKGRARDLLVQPRNQRFVNLTQSRLQAAVHGTGLSVFTPSPKELSDAAQLARSRLTYVMRLRFDMNKCPPPPGYVRVQFFMSLDMIKYVGRKPSLEADLPLEPTGEFDMKRVRELWGLEKCVPIDPVRWKVFEPVSDRISPLAVMTLSAHYNALRFIEPSVSQSTLIKRRIRHAAVPRLLALYTFYTAVSRRCEQFLAHYTSLIVWYSAAQRQREIFEWRLQRWASENEELGRMVLALCIIAIIVFIVSLMEGYVDVGSTERVERWIWMRV
ncbi:hypothetical protein L208DRAFT_1362156 [Tricholoma matsutake]|nr:hypothetical protein L208DRAFT_1362156 [Tricholoma matsutake 945]